MNTERRDYGAPLRVWQLGSHYHILPPRSGRAAERFFFPEFNVWRGLKWAPSFEVRDAPMRPGPHLGKRIHWRDLPPVVQSFARQSAIGEYCPGQTQAEMLKGGA